MSTESATGTIVFQPKKSVYWMHTWNNPPEAALSMLRELEVRDEVRRMVVVSDVAPTTGTRHLHAMCEFRTPKSLSVVKKMVSAGHWDSHVGDGGFKYVTPGPGNSKKVIYEYVRPDKRRKEDPVMQNKYRVAAEIIALMEAGATQAQLRNHNKVWWMYNSRYVADYEAHVATWPDDGSADDRRMVVYTRVEDLNLKAKVEAMKEEVAMLTQKLYDMKEKYEPDQDE